MMDVEMNLALSLLVVFLLPYFAMRIHHKKGLPFGLNPIIICYAVGLLSSLILFNEALNPLIEGIMNVTILLAISLHLFQSSFKNLATFGKPLIIAYLSCIILAGALSSILCIWHQDQIPEFDKLSGMLAGLYSGGNLNLSAVGKSMGASNELITSALYSDIFSGTFLLLFLISIGPFCYGLFLKKGKKEHEAIEKIEQESSLFFSKPKENIKGIGLAIITLGFALFPFAIPTWSTSNQTMAVFILITLFSLIIAQTNWVKSKYQTTVSGDYFLLVFCTCISLHADLETLIVLAQKLLPVFALLIILTMVSHIIICRIFGIPREETMVAFVAALFGVPFISQMTTTLKAPHLLTGGIGLAVLGMAIGNLFGLGVGLFTNYLAGIF